MKIRSRTKKKTISKLRRKPSIPQKMKRHKNVGSLDKSLAALLRWSQQAHGLSADVRRAVEDFQGGVMLAAARHCISGMQKQRPILEELYVWKSEITSQMAQPDTMKTHLEEGAVLVEALFNILSREFQIKIMHEPGEEIPTPRRLGRAYKFQGRFRPDSSTSRVLFPGLQQGKSVISPCEVGQQ